MPETIHAELTRDVKELTVQIARVVTQLELWTPILERQTAGLINQENRISRIEDRVEAFASQRIEDRKEDREAIEDRNKAATLWLSFIAILVTIIGHFWK